MIADLSRQKGRISGAWILISIVILIVGALLSVVIVGLGQFGLQPDTRRFSGIRTAGEALQLYYQKFGRYPIVSGEDNWDGLVEKLRTANIGVTWLANDPQYPKKTYIYGFSDDGQHF